MKQESGNKQCECTGPWDCQCTDVLAEYYGTPEERVGNDGFMFDKNSTYPAEDIKELREENTRLREAVKKAEDHLNEWRVRYYTKEEVEALLLKICRICDDHLTTEKDITLWLKSQKVKP